MKKISEISIHVTHQASDPGANLNKQVEVAVLKDKMDDYLFRLGRSNTSVYAIMMQLLTKGKVRVDFRDFAERLALASAEDRMTTVQASTLTEAYFQSLPKDEKAGDPNTVEATHCFVAQGKRPVSDKEP
jgi:hypothetical protein